MRYFYVCSTFRVQLVSQNFSRHMVLGGTQNFSQQVQINVLAKFESSFL